MTCWPNRAIPYIPNVMFWRNRPTKRAMWSYEIYISVRITDSVKLLYTACVVIYKTGFLSNKLMIALLQQPCSIWKTYRIHYGNEKKQNYIHQHVVNLSNEKVYLYTQTRKLFLFVQVSSKSCMHVFNAILAVGCCMVLKKETDEVYTYTFFGNLFHSLYKYNLSSTFDIDHDEIYHHYAICRGIIMRTASVDRRLCKVVSRGCSPPRNDVNRHVDMIGSSTKGDG